MSKKVKVKNPNSDSEMKKLLVILAVIAVVGVGAYIGIHEYAKSKNDLSGEFHAIVDITAPEVTATIEEATESEEPAKVVKFTVNDQAGGSGLYGLCLSEEGNIDKLLVDDPECFDFLSLESNVNATMDVTIPIDEGISTTYFAYAKDNFGNISDAYSFVIE